MAGLPTPTGASPLPNLTSTTQTTRAQAVAGYVAQLSSLYGTQVGNSYQGYANTHTSQSAATALQNWANTLASSLGPSLAGTIQQFAKDAATGVGQQATGAALGAGQAAKDILGGFNLGSWFLRIGEILVGLVLIGVGLAKITNAVPVATKIARVVK